MKMLTANGVKMTDAIHRMDQGYYMVGLYQAVRHVSRERLELLLNALGPFLSPQEIYTKI